jgi:hypothetical protein
MLVAIISCNISFAACPGLFMAVQPKIIACGNKVAALTMAIRFLFGPAVMAATSAAVGLRGTLLRVAIVQVTIFLCYKAVGLHIHVVTIKIALILYAHICW